MSVTSQYQRLTVHLGGDKSLVRRAKLEGRDHYVVPAAMMAEGVWNGSGGKIFYPERELAHACPAWNYKPLVVYHPKDKDGVPVSACTPDVLNTRKVGVVLNVRYEGKQRAECWFDIERTKEVDRRVLDAIERGTQLEGSTGLFVDNDEVGGEWGDGEYDGTARNHRPDHFAVLPDQKGAYSIADGGGIMTVNIAPTEAERVQVVLRKGLIDVLGTAGIQLTGNELSFTDVSCQLSDLLSEKYGRRGKYWEGYVRAVYPGYVVFNTPGKDGTPYRMFQIEYAVKGDVVSLKGDAKEVEQVVEYRPVGNAVATGLETPGVHDEGNDMSFDRKAHLQSLIGNGWEEADRPVLEAMSDAQLTKIQPIKANATGTPPVVEAEKPAEKKPKTLEDVFLEFMKEKAATPNTVVENVTPAPKPTTLKDLIAHADPETKAQLQGALAMADRWAKHVNGKKEVFADRIIAHQEACGATRKFKKDFLMNKDVEELESMAALLPEADRPTANAGHGMFDLAGGDETQIGNAGAAQPAGEVGESWEDTEKYFAANGRK